MGEVLSLAVAVMAEMRRHVQRLGLCQLYKHTYLHVDSTNQIRCIYNSAHVQDVWHSRLCKAHSTVHN
jgi:hypothetical protein